MSENTLQKIRDLLLKIGDGKEPENFTTIGAARLIKMTFNSNLKMLEISLEGIFKDVAAEEILRLAAFNRTAKNYQLMLPDGTIYQKSFIVQEYRCEGNYDGYETFSVQFIDKEHHHD